MIAVEREFFIEPLEIVGKFDRRPHYANLVHLNRFAVVYRVMQGLRDGLQGQE
jgi:hypothetical protein